MQFCLLRIQIFFGIYINFTKKVILQIKILPLTCFFSYKLHLLYKIAFNFLVDIKVSVSLTFGIYFSFRNYFYNLPIINKHTKNVHFKFSFLEIELSDLKFFDNSFEVNFENFVIFKIFKVNCE